MYPRFSHSLRFSGNFLVEVPSEQRNLPYQHVQASVFCTGISNDQKHECGIHVYDYVNSETAANLNSNGLYHLEGRLIAPQGTQEEDEAAHERFICESGSGPFELKDESAVADKLYNKTAVYGRGTIVACSRNKDQTLVVILRHRDQDPIASKVIDFTAEYHFIPNGKLRNKLWICEAENRGVGAVVSLSGVMKYFDSETQRWIINVRESRDGS